MWFRHDLLVTDALRRIITHNRGKVENEMIHIISDLMQIQLINKFSLSVLRRQASAAARSPAVSNTKVCFQMLFSYVEIISFVLKISIIRHFTYRKYRIIDIFFAKARKVFETAKYCFV
jgi:hypothetical protein